MVLPKSQKTVWFMISGEEYVNEFEGKIDVSETMDDQKLIYFLKEDSSTTVKQRKLNGKKVNVYVYEWVGKTEVAINISNTSVSTYQEKLLIKKI